MIDEPGSSVASVAQSAGGPAGALVVIRLRAAAAVDLGSGLGDCVTALAARPGFLSAETGRNADEPDLVILITRWRDIGSYRRALGAYEVKVAMMPVMVHAFDEPSVYEPFDKDS